MSPENNTGIHSSGNDENTVAKPPKDKDTESGHEENHKKISKELLKYRKRKSNDTFQGSLPYDNSKKAGS